MPGRSRSSMRVTVIWPYFPPELGGASNRGAALVEALLRAGHDVTLVTPRPSYFLPWHGRLKRASDPNNHGSQRAVADSDGISTSAGSRRLHTIRLPIGLRPKSKLRSLRVAREIFGSLTLPLWASRAIVRSDVVVTSTPPLAYGFVGVVLARALRRRVVLDVRDRWPDVLVQAGKVRPSSPLAAAASAMSRTAYRLATLITAVTQGDVDVLVSQGVPHDKVLLAVNGVEDKVLRAGADGLDKPIQFRIVYAGLLGPAQGVELLFDALQHVDLPLRVDVVGTGSEEPTLGSYVALALRGQIPRSARQRRLPRNHEKGTRGVRSIGVERDERNGSLETVRSHGARTSRIGSSKRGSGVVGVVFRRRLGFGATGHQSVSGEHPPALLRQGVRGPDGNTRQRVGGKELYPRRDLRGALVEDRTTPPSGVEVRSSLIAIGSPTSPSIEGHRSPPP